MHTRLLWLMLAGALGAASRYGLNLWIQGWLGGHGSQSYLGSRLGSAFPLSTLLINVTGALLLSFLVTLVARGALKPDLQIILGTGFLGAYTTFSTFELEAERLLSLREWLQAGVYIGGNLVLGFLAILLGRLIALKMVGA